MLKHRLYSLDLASYDSFHSPKVNLAYKRKRFETVDGARRKAMQTMNMLFENDF